MKITKHTIKITNDSFKQKRKYFSDNYPHTIHLYLLHGWYKVYNEDAQIISDLLHYKLFFNNSNLSEVCCGFPNYAIEKVKNYLQKNKIAFNIVNIEKNTYEIYDFSEDKINYNPKNITKNKNNYNQVKIGNTIIIKNTLTNKTETYTIVETYYEGKPVGISRYKNSFGAIKYKKVVDNTHDVNAGQILSISPFAQILLDKYVNDIVILKDEDGEACPYQILDIKNN